MKEETRIVNEIIDELKKSKQIFAPKKNYQRDEKIFICFNVCVIISLIILFIYIYM